MTVMETRVIRIAYVLHLTRGVLRDNSGQD